ncbi:MAG: helix-turn-helix transcriptional regulator [Providencia sp.]|uniref:helix-turn-helix transcriptional regulator n=1 Tax=Providencia sp. TaxID=589 RepID=UPI003F954D8B
MDNRYLDIKGVEEYTGYKKSYIYNEIKHGRFPRQVKNGVSSRWPAEQIKQWLDKQFTHQ